MPLTIAIISIPNAGHINILARFAQEAKEYSPPLAIKFILTSWSKHKIRERYLQTLAQHSKDVTILESQCTACNKGDTFGRARELMDAVIQACKGCDYIIYDFMTPEGYMAGKVLSIPALCVDPSYVGEFDTSSEEYKSQVEKCRSDIQAVEGNYKITLLPELKLISGALSFISATNILFSWEKLIRAGDFEKNTTQEKKMYYFARPSRIAKPLDKEFSYLNHCNKKIIYFSLGTISSGIAWEETANTQGHSLQSFITFIYKTLISIFIRRQDLILILSTGRNPTDLVDECKLTENIHVYESLNQTHLLHHVDLFITHCGANSVNEAIDAETPMIGIPLMYDQHQCAQALFDLGLGHIFPLPLDQRESAVYVEANTFYRHPMTANNNEMAAEALEKTIDKILSQDFSARFLHAKSGMQPGFKKIYHLFK